jgi:hypothetical protein
LESVISRDEEGGRILQYSAVLKEARMTPEKLRGEYGIQKPALFESDIDAYSATHPDYLNRHKKTPSLAEETDADRAWKRWKEIYATSTILDDGFWPIAEQLRRSK